MIRIHLIIIALLLIPVAFLEMREYERDCKRDMRDSEKRRTYG